MYRRTTSPNQNQGNFLKIPVTDNLCCGSGGKVILETYRTRADTAVLTTVDRVSLNGVVKMFPAAYSTTTAEGRASIAAAINEEIKKLIGVNDGTTIVTLDGTTLLVAVDYSEVVVDSIGNAGNTAYLLPINAWVAGSADQDGAGFFIRVEKTTPTTYDLYVRPIGAKTITAVSINWNGGAVEYTGAYPGGTLAGGAVMVGLSIKIPSIPAATAEAAAALAISVTAGTTRTFSQSVILANYKV